MPPRIGRRLVLNLWVRVAERLNDFREDFLEILRLRFIYLTFVYNVSN